MKVLKKLLEKNAFSLSPESKSKLFTKYINQLTLYHYQKSELYNKYLKGLNYRINKKHNLSQIPFLPVRLFKEFDFLSIKKKDIFKTLFSSGTTSGKLSKVYIDKNNALNQIKVLQNIFYNIIGNSRLPMIVVDKEFSKLDRNNFNASAAAIKGFSIFSNNIFYLLDDRDNINYSKLNNFLNKNQKNKILIFGFTSNIFKHFIKKINLKKVNIKNFSNTLLIHGGGWKKIEDKKISRERFNSVLKKKYKINKIINYYGLVEQIGSIFFECNCGYFISSNYSDIIVRDENLEICKNGESGIIQLVSLLPTSYPGHSILTEDVGRIVTKHNCKCYGNGTRFLIYGRLKNAELRGCSNI